MVRRLHAGAVDGVWIGYKEANKPLLNIRGLNRVTGGTIPAQIWAAYRNPRCRESHRLPSPSPSSRWPCRAAATPDPSLLSVEPSYVPFTPDPEIPTPTYSPPPTAAGLDGRQPPLGPVR